jgi:hypothetical protein
MNYIPPIIIFDIETKLIQRSQCPDLIGFIHNNKIKVYDKSSCITDFFNYILADGLKQIDLYSHNFSGFDSYFVVPELLSRKAIVQKMFIKNNNIIFFQCLIGTTVLTFRDSFLYITLPLKEVYKMVGLDKNYFFSFNRGQLAAYLIFDLLGLKCALVALES